MSAETNHYLETEPLGKLMVKYMIPCVVAMLVAALYNIVDQIFIANASYLGSYGNAANTVVFPMTVVAIAIAVMIGNGCCAFVSISLGAKRREEASQGVGNAISAVIVVSLVLTAIYLLFQEPIISMFGARVNEETFRLSKEYFFWITLGIPFYMFGQAMNPVIRSDGNQNYAMGMLLVGAAFNIIFDPICIYVLKWGMMGAAIATIGGQILTAVMAAVYLPRMKATLLSKSCFAFQWKVLKKVLTLGVSDFFSQFSIVLSMAATINMAVKYGALDPIFSQMEYAQIPTAIAGIVSKFFQIVIQVSVGMAAGCTPIVGYNYGAKRNDRVVGVMKRLMTAEFVLGLVATLVFLIFPYQLMLIFGSESEGVYYTEFAVWFIRGQLCLLPLACVDKGSFIFLQALGKPKEASILSVSHEFIFNVGFALLLPMIWGLYALPFFMPLSDALVFIGVVFVLARVIREMKESTQAEIDFSEKERFVPSSEPALTDSIITIGRSYGSGGRSVGRLLAEKLNIPYYDAALLEGTAKHSGLSQKYLEGMDEKPVSSTMLYQYGFNFNHDSFLENQARQAQQEVVTMVAANGPCVIVGRRADQVLKDSTNLVRVFITGSKESRVRRISERDHLTEKESAAKLERIDRERAAYYNLYAESRWGEAETYDLCIETDRLGIEGAVGIILTVVKAMEQA